MKGTTVKTMRKAAVLLASFALLLAACGGESAEPDETGTDVGEDAAEEAPDQAEDDAAGEPDDADADDVLLETRGPGGEAPTPSTDIQLTDDQVEQLRSGEYTAALLWHTSSDFVNAVSAGATDTFEDLGIEVIATTDAGFDSAKQVSDVETVLARQPDAIISLPLDPVSSAQAFRPAVEQGTALVFLSNLPDGYVHGEDYVSLVTDDLFDMGRLAADAMADALDGEGEVAWIFHDAAYYVTNQRDDAFKTTIERDHPGIEIVAEQGIADPARAEEIANALLTQNPDLDGIYVTWAEPAEGVVSALRAAGRDDVAVVTLDLSETLGLDMVQGGNVVAMVADEAYELGASMARAAALGILGETGPEFAIAPALKVTSDNIQDGWQTSLRRDPPQSILDALN